MKPQTVTIWPANLHRRIRKDKQPLYKVNYDDFSPWYIRLAFWMLTKQQVISTHWEAIETWTYVPAKQNDLHTVIMNCIRQDIDYVNEGKAVFLIGGKDFSELAGSPVFREVTTFSTGPFHRNDPYRGRQIYGFPIHVVPHMTGVALVPRVLIEQKS
jgi:hypothetical protein